MLQTSPRIRVALDAHVVGRQKTGNETPMIARSIVARLENAFRRTADKIPMGIPNISQMKAAPTPSVIEMGRRRAISSLTGMKLPYE